jgi:hypothetical protein
MVSWVPVDHRARAGRARPLHRGLAPHGPPGHRSSLAT